MVSVSHKVGAKALASGHVQQLHLQRVGGGSQFTKRQHLAPYFCCSFLWHSAVTPQHATGLAADGGEQNTPVIGKHGQASTLVLFRLCWELSKAAA